MQRWTEGNSASNGVWNYLSYAKNLDLRNVPKRDPHQGELHGARDTALKHEPNLFGSSPLTCHSFLIERSILC